MPTFVRDTRRVTSLPTSGTSGVADATTDRVTASGVAIALGTLVLLLGALAVRSRVVFGLVVVAAVFVPMERLFALRPQRVFRQAWKTDLVHFVVNNVLTTIGLVVAVVVAGGLLHALVPDPFRHAVHNQDALAQLTEALLVAEMAGYWAHRATHRVPWLWRFHKVHHSIEQMDWLAAARLHPVDQAFTRSCFVVPLYALGFSRATFGAFLVFATFQALFVHANVRFRFGPLRYVIATPEFHHWHHGGEPAAYNSNFAGELPLIDAVFGTLRIPDRWPERYGIGEPIPSGYLRQLAWPFRGRGDRRESRAGPPTVAAPRTP
jgi:sterol desaturase/sphingolipid hydroxylase (fatty acid hydroxylase superfamily)